MHDADADTSFWLGLKARSMKVEFVRQIVRPDRASMIFRVEVVSGMPNGQTVTVTDDQYWLKQGDQWRLVGIERTDCAPPEAALGHEEEYLSGGCGRARRN